MATQNPTPSTTPAIEAPLATATPVCPPAAAPRTAANQPLQDTAGTSSPSELTAVVDDLLESLSTKFASVSTEVYGKIEAMSKRLDAMEASLQQQQQQQQQGAGK